MKDSSGERARVEIVRYDLLAQKIKKLKMDSNDLRRFIV